jgi:hypothetical protein
MVLKTIRFKTYHDALKYVLRIDYMSNDEPPNKKTLQCIIRETLVWSPQMFSIIYLDTIDMRQEWFFARDGITDKGLLCVNKKIIIVYQRSPAKDKVLLLSCCHDGACTWSRLLVHILTALQVYGNCIVSFDAKAYIAGQSQWFCVLLHT